MFAGVGIIGSLASILASILVPDAPAEAARKPPNRNRSGGRRDIRQRPVESELAAIRIELTAMRELLANQP